MKPPTDKEKRILWMLEAARGRRLELPSQHIAVAQKLARDGRARCMRGNWYEITNKGQVELQKLCRTYEEVSKT